MKKYKIKWCFPLYWDYWDGWDAENRMIGENKVGQFLHFLLVFPSLVADTQIYNWLCPSIGP